MPLELDKVMAEVKHLNIRREGPGDDKVLAVDVKIKTTVLPEVLLQFDETLRMMLFKADGNVRYPMMDPVGWGGEMLHMEITLGSVEVRDAKLKGFELLPRMDKSGPVVDLTFSASFQPTGREVAIIAENVQEAVQLTVKSQPALDLRGVDKNTGELRKAIEDGFVAAGGVKQPDGSIDMAGAGMPGASLLPPDSAPPASRKAKGGVGPRAKKQRKAAA